MTNNMVPDDELMIVGGSTIRYVPGLVNIQKTMENHHFSWDNQL